MKYVCVQPASLYYAWQVEVMLYSFIKNKVQPQDIHIILAVQGNYKDSYFEQLQFRYPKVNFKFYQDDRPTANYISSIRPYLLLKYFKENPELEKEKWEGGTDKIVSEAVEAIKNITEQLEQLENE